MTDPVKTGALIAMLRKRYNMTQAQLGEKLMVSAQAVSKWESGQTLPDAALLSDLAAALYRKETYHFDQCLYIVAYQQDLHFKQLFKVLELMGYDWVQEQILRKCSP